MKAAYGAWRSPITSDLIVAESIGIAGAGFAGSTLYWGEGRPQQGGRIAIVRRNEDGTTTDLVPEPFNARTRVHEYGGGAWLVHDGKAIFSNFVDQQLYVAGDGNEPTRLTQTPDLRFANGSVDTTRNRLVYVIEDHSGDGEPANLIGAVSLETGEVTFLTQGHDFYSSPTLNEDASKLAWITWDHPDMPWDGTELWLADINSDGSLANIEKVCGGRDESVQQPQFAPNGTLYFISDSSGWWNLYRLNGDTIEPVVTRDAEFAGPHWVFGGTSYAFTDAETIVCIYSENNIDTLARLDLSSGQLTAIDTPFGTMDGVSLDGNLMATVAASPTRFRSVVLLDTRSGDSEIVKVSTSVDLDTGYYSVPEAISFPTADDDTAHAFFYPPANKDFEAPDDELPPLIVMVHGGPTGATHNDLSLSKQFWTSRGFAVVDVNYRGSTGYGRKYRQKLNLRWGVVDVEDVVHVSRHLAEKGRVDPDRLAIRGGSAGGYTTLAALAFENTFKAGASHFGVGDLEALAKDTHKFESRYLDSMIGAYPEDMETYKSRSPINHVDGLSCPVIFFQGLEDKVVPPNQAEAMVEALTEKGIPNAYVPFEGEQHGFRQAKNIKRALDLELYFYSRIFGFSCADQIEPIEITNL